MRRGGHPEDIINKKTDTKRNLPLLSNLIASGHARSATQTKRGEIPTPSPQGCHRVRVQVSYSSSRYE